MAISKPRAGAEYEEIIAGEPRSVLLRNDEIERFEIQHEPFGIYEFWDRMMGRGLAVQNRHVRDIIALALVGGGMRDRQADDLVRGIPPSENLALLATAKRIVGVTFMPDVLNVPEKKRAGSQGAKNRAKPTTTLPNA